MIAYHHFINHTPERAGRVYSLWLQQDLFGQWTLMRFQGGCHREPVLYSQVVESREAGEKLVAQLVRVRLLHGYVESTKRNGPPPSLQKAHNLWVFRIASGLSTPYTG